MGGNLASRRPIRIQVPLGRLSNLEVVGFAPVFVQYVLVNFSTNTAPIGTKLGTRSQWVPTMLVSQLNGSPRAYRKLRLGVDTVLEKTVFFDAFFTNWL